MKTKEIGICCFCNMQKPLIKAHIIPEAFFRAVGAGKTSPLLFTSVPGFPHPRRAPIGVYDNNILCDSCERKFDKVDAYGTNTFLHKLRGDALKPIKRGNNVVGFQAAGVDQELLRRFLVATLWRASVSSHPFFDRVRIGARYEALGKKAVSSEPLDDAFDAVIFCWLSNDGRDESRGFMDPFAERYDGINGYRFYFGAYSAHIKVDQRPLSESFKHIALGTQPFLNIVRRDHRNSKDFAAMLITASVQHENSLKAKQNKS